MRNISSVRKVIERLRKEATFSKRLLEMLLSSIALILKTKSHKNKKYTIRRLHENFDTCEEVYDDDVRDETNKQAGRLEGGSSCSRLT